jgi:membrane fusion protein (multidrug efflux system)
VESIMAGSGARFSLLPPENAVGNYVKVVQRVPVKIVFDEPLPTEHVLGPGMSVVPSVRVRSTEISETVVLVLAILLATLTGAGWWMLTRRKR